MIVNGLFGEQMEVTSPGKVKTVRLDVTSGPTGYKQRCTIVMSLEEAWNLGVSLEAMTRQKMEGLDNKEKASE